MRRELKKKLVLILLMLALVVSTVYTVIAASLDTTSGTTASFAITKQQPFNNKYYQVNTTSGTRDVYRTYWSGGSTDAEKYGSNIFCLDAYGKFPTEDSSNTASYTSQGQLTTSSGVNVHSTSGSSTTTALTSEQIGKVLAVLNAGYRYDTYQSSTTGLEELLNEVMYMVDESDEAPTGADIISQGFITADDVFVCEQLVIWSITNGLDVTTIEESTNGTSYDTKNNTGQARDIQTAIFSYFNNIVANYESYLPSTNYPAFSTTTKSVTRISDTQYRAGGFKVTNYSNAASYEIVGVDANGTETTLSSQKLYKTSSGTDTYTSIKSTSGSEFYVELSATEYAAYTKVIVRVTSTDQVVATLWTESNSNASAQPLVTIDSESKTVEDSVSWEQPTYDIALRKFITKVNGVDVTTSREPELEVSTSSDAFNNEDYQYNHIKEPVEVAVGDTVTYRIQVYNECENAVIITGISDYLPDGLELVSSSNWTQVSGTNEVRYNGSSLTLAGTTSSSDVQSSYVEIECKVTSATNNDILTNVAEVTGMTDANGYSITDEDSQVNNLSSSTKGCDDDYEGNSSHTSLNDSTFYYYGEQDDDDFEKLIVKAEGSYSVNLEKVDASGNIITSGEATFTINGTSSTTSSGKLVVADTVLITDVNTSDTYTIVETEAPSGYTKYDKTIVLTVNKKQSGSSYLVDSFTVKDSSGNDISSEVNVSLDSTGTVITIQVINQLVEGTYNIKLIKTDSSGNTITSSEAKFTIDGTEYSTTNGTLDVASNVEIKDITSVDTYTIVETEAPTGYVKYDGEINIEVTKKQDGTNYLIDTVTVTDEDGNEFTTDEVTYTLADSIITIKVQNEEEEEPEIDLALRKFIATINGTAQNREPSVDTSKLADGSETTATYNHSKDAIDVNVGDIIVYTIRVYNEGSTDAYAKEITDYIPEGLGYLVNYKINTDNGWVMEDSASVISYSSLPETMLAKINTQLVASDFYASDGTSTETDLSNVNIALGSLKITTNKLSTSEYKIDKYSGGSTLDYESVQVACIVLNADAYNNANKSTTLVEGKILTNIAAVTEYGDENNLTVPSDRDSEPDDINPSTYTTWEEDDDDYDPVVYNSSSFDLALKKFITTVKTPNEDGTTTETEYNRMLSVNSSTLSSSTDASYTMDKETVKVKTGDTVVYTIRIFNEGDEAGTALEIADSLPEGLEFVSYVTDSDGNYVSGSKINYTYGWKLLVDSTSNTWQTGVYTTYLADKSIPAYDSNSGEISYLDVQIELKVTATESEVIKNIAEILDDSGYDIDSTPNNLDEDEDDQDYDTIIPQQFDLALQKFISAVDNVAVTGREPTLALTSDGEISYTHTTDPYIVVNGNVVTYTIRIYNEGEIDGYPTYVKDDIPDGLKFVTDSTINTTYGWKMYRALTEDEQNDTSTVEGTIITIGGVQYVEVSDQSKADIIATDYYSYDNATARGETAIKAYDPDAGITTTNPDYRDLQVDFEVVEDEITASDRIIINTAEIADDEDDLGNPIKDKDSTPNNDEEEEDDIDKEYLQLKYFDLSLLKYVSKVEVTEDGTTKTTETGYDGTENPEPVVKVEINRNKLSSTTVKFTFTIKITNEGEIAGYAKEITDYIPDGLEFYEEDNTDYNWVEASDGVVTTDYLADTLLEPGESATVPIVLRWINSSSNLSLKTNVAEISEDYNEYGAPDIDSTPDNQVDGEDDQDDASVILSISTGGTQLYIILTLIILAVLSIGGFSIYRYVYKPQNTLLTDNKKYSHKRKKRAKRNR